MPAQDELGQCSRCGTSIYRRICYKLPPAPINVGLIDDAPVSLVFERIVYYEYRTPVGAHDDLEPIKNCPGCGGTLI